MTVLSDLSLENTNTGDLENTTNKFVEQSKQIVTPPLKIISNSFGERVLAAAQADVGVHEDLGKNDGKRIRQYFDYFHSPAGQDWCAAAVSAWMKEAGGGPISGALGARNIANQFQQVGRWIPRSKVTPQVLIPGNISIWSRGNPDSWHGHIGVIESINGSSFTSIEGNSGPSGDSVVRNTHNINESSFLGIGDLSNYSDDRTASWIVKIEKLAKLLASFP